MTNTPSLFDSMTPVEKVLQPTAGRVHHGDPVTSRKAAERVSLRSGSQKAKLLLLLAERVEDTPHNLFAEAGCAYPHVATTRLEEMAAEGWVLMTPHEKPTRWGGESHVWKVLPAGLEAAAELRARVAA